MSPTTQAVIFDLDGVLVDTEPLYTLAIQEVVAPFGKVYDRPLKSLCMGNPATVSARIIVERLCLPITPEDFLARREPVLERLFAGVAEKSGAGALVRALHERRYRLAVATSSNRALLALKTGHHEFMSYFSAVVCSDDEKLARPKPAPDIFLLAAERLGVPADRCLVFEDSPVGVRAGLAAGMRVVALADPELDRSHFVDAELVISSYAELPDDLLAAAAE